MKKILLHICCGPCATATIRRLQSEGFEVIGYYYNPNIHPVAEHQKRLTEAKKLADNLGIELVVEDYDPGEYFEAVGLPGKREVDFQSLTNKTFPGPKVRCPKCWRLRLEKTAAKAKSLGIQNIGSTLRISPHQDQERLLKIAKKLAQKYDLEFYEAELKSCFSESVALSKEAKMYRQKYCGCIFSRSYK